MKLSDRLQRIADRIERGETMADIGTDHGLLPIYLTENGISPKAVMTDISEPSLMKGRENLAGSMPDGHETVDCRTGDGLSVLAPAEVDVIVIAGMGGRLIRQIMEADMALTRSFAKFILQPRTKQGELRRWLLENGFAIIHEDLVHEGRHIPEIITAVHGEDRRYAETGRAGDLWVTKETADAYGEKTDMFYDVPPWITKATGPVDEFMGRYIEREKRKLENVMMSQVRDREKETRICGDIYYLKGLSEV